MAADTQIIQLKEGLRQKLENRLQERLKVQRKTRDAAGGRQTLGDVVREIREELQSQEAHCRVQEEMDAAGLFRLLRMEILPDIVRDIENSLVD